MGTRSDARMKYGPRYGTPYMEETDIPLLYTTEEIIETLDREHNPDLQQIREEVLEQNE